MKQILFIVFCAFNSLLSTAQKNVTTTFETIKNQCKDLPLNKRVIVTVPRFSVTTNTAPADFGGNLATMLTNALQGVNCYRVLESLINNPDTHGEIDNGQTEYAKKSAAPKKGKQLSAQVIITGELTEYSVKSNGLRIGFVKTGGNTAKIGFILKMVNPETRDVLYSQSINVTGKTGGITEFGALGLNIVSSGNSDPAVTNACEQGIIKAVEFLASKKDSINLDASVKKNDDATAINETEITLTEANFNSFNAFATLLTSVVGYKSVEKSLKSGIATYTLSHTGTSTALLEELNKKAGTKYEVTGFDEGKIELKVK